MFGYIKQVEVEIAQEAARPLSATIGPDVQQESVATPEPAAGFWRWWISLYRPDSCPTTAYL
jgi:hypothetical protein